MNGSCRPNLNGCVGELTIKEKFDGYEEVLERGISELMAKLLEKSSK